MRRTLLLSLALLLSMTMFSQSRAIFIDETFDDYYELPTGWSIMGDGIDNWSISETNKCGGTAPEMKMYWSPHFTGDSRLVTAPLNLTNVSSLVVSFKHCLQRYAGSNTIGIATSSDGGTTWNSGWTKSYTSSGVYEVSENITTADMGKNNVLLCVYFTGSSMDIERWFFDDIKVFSQENNDVAITSTNVPEYFVYGEQEVGFSIQNIGINTIENFVAKCKVDNVNVLTQTFTTNLVNSQSAEFTFDSSCDFTPGAHNFSIEITSLNGNNDDDMSNNTLSKNTYAAMKSVQKIPMIEHFSSSTCVPCVQVNQQMEELTNDNSGKYTYTKYAMNFPNMGDPYYTTEGLTRKAYYSVSGVPQIFLDGKDEGTPITQSDLDEYYNRTAFIDIKASFKMTGKTIKVIADIMPYVDIEDKNLFVVVNEKTTEDNASSNGETEFHHIMMKMLGGAEGTPININGGEFERFEFSQNLSSTYMEQTTDLEVAIWIQDMETKEIHNSSFAYGYCSHPYPVENIILTKEGNNIIASWELPEEVTPTSYKVYVNNELISESSEMSCVIEDAEDNSYIEVFAIYDGKSSVGKSIIYNSEYEVPDNLTAIAGEDNIVVSWNAAQGANSYQLYRDGEMIKETTSCSYTDNTAIAGTEYCYKVRAVYDDATSPFSPETCAMIEIVILPCDAPTLLNATVEQDAEGFEYNFKVTMSWSNVDYAQQYKLYLDGELLETLTETSFVKGFDEEGEHHFSVATVCEDGESEQSEKFEFEIKGVSVDELENNFVIYPNPAKDKIKLSAVSCQLSAARVYNYLGILVEEISVGTRHATSVEINVSDYNPGIYFINIQTENGNLIKKFIKN